MCLLISVTECHNSFKLSCVRRVNLGQRRDEFAGLESACRYITGLGGMVGVLQHYWGFECRLPQHCGRTGTAMPAMLIVTVLFVFLRFVLFFFGLFSGFIRLSIYPH